MKEKRKEIYCQCTSQTVNRQKVSFISHLHCLSQRKLFQLRLQHSNTQPLSQRTSRCAASDSCQQLNQQHKAHIPPKLKNELLRSDSLFAANPEAHSLWLHHTHPQNKGERAAAQRQPLIQQRPKSAYHFHTIWAACNALSSVIDYLWQYLYTREGL